MKNCNLQLITKIVVCIFVVVQIVILYVFWGAPQYSDNKAYMDLALNCYENGTWYPMEQNLYDRYIWAPGLINYFILQLKLFGTLNFNSVFNFIMNMIMLVDIFLLAKKLFNEKTAYWSIIIYSITYSNIIGIALSGTEIPFLFGVLTGLTFCIYKQTFGYLFLSAFLFFISNTIRPLSIIFLLVVCFYFFIKRYRLIKFAYIIIPFLLFNVLYGFYNKHKVGEFVYQSVTSGVNLIFTANDYADGTTAKGIEAVNDSTKNCYIGPFLNDRTIDNKEKDQVLKTMAVHWILENPFRYIGMFPYKIFYMYADDAWGERLITNNGFTKELKNATGFGKIKAIVFVLLKNIIYYLTCLLFLYSLIVNRKDILSVRGILLLLLLLGTGATCVFAVLPRYHYPFMFIIVIWAAYGMNTLASQKRNYSHELQGT